MTKVVQSLAGIATNKLKIFNFYWKPVTDQKFAETNQEKQETNQQTENFRTFLKTGNGPKILRKLIKEKGNRPTNWKFITFFKLETNLKYAETERKERKLNNKLKINKVFLIKFLKKEWNRPKVTFWSVSALRRFNPLAPFSVLGWNYFQIWIYAIRAENFRMRYP